MNCNGCTLCCTLLPVPWMDSAAGEACSECAVGIECKIFAKADKRCKDFECMYRQTSCNEELRPDRCGVVFEKLSETLLYGSVDPDIGFTDVAKRQVSEFQRQGFGVVLDLMAEERLIVAKPKNMSSESVMQEFLQRREQHRQ